MPGTQADILARLKSVLPRGWFSESSPILDAVLNGIAAAFASSYALIQYAALQTRLSTATDQFLDLIAFDYFGGRLPRNAAESDATYRSRIISALFPERGTRKGIIKALTLLTGRAPVVFEPANVVDTGAYDTNTLGYDAAGAYGSTDFHAQAFLNAYRPANSGIPYVAGYDSPAGGYDTPSRASYTDLNQIIGYVTDPDIYAAVDAAKAAGTIAWTQIDS